MNHFISVVIPNFNGRKLLQANLPSVIGALDVSGLDHEIIVSDDASTDDSLEFLAKYFPQIISVRNASNQGFAKNINSGLKQARGSLVLALNNDVSLDKDYFEFQLPFFESSETFGVMGALCNPKTGQIEDGAKLCEQGLMGTIRSTRNLMPKDGSSLVTLFLSGANALMDRKKLQLLGFYDELFSPFYNEDVELGIRAWRMGWKCYFEPRSKAFHAVSQTIGGCSSPSEVRIVSLRNRFFIQYIHLGGIKRLLFFCDLGLSVLFRWAFRDWGFYRAFRSFVVHIPALDHSKSRFLNLRPHFSFAQTCEILRFLQKQSQCEVF